MSNDEDIERDIGCLRGNKTCGEAMLKLLTPIALTARTEIE